MCSSHFYAQKKLMLEKTVNRLIAFGFLSFAFAVPSANAVVYCKSVGVPKGCVVRPAAAPGVGAPGVGVGAPGVDVVDPGINQPGASGNVGVPGNRGGPVNRVGPR
jgi:hypothetical protein